MKRVDYFLALCISLLVTTVQADTPQDGFCGIINTTTRDGEEITYTVFYAVAGIYVNAGGATFTNTTEKLNGKTIYHVKGVGQSSPAYDWIYKVRDTYESFIDSATMQPLQFNREVQEGKTRKSE